VRKLDISATMYDTIDLEMDIRVYSTGESSKTTSLGGVSETPVTDCAGSIRSTVRTQLSPYQESVQERRASSCACI
jgi:hypothetical protein